MCIWHSGENAAWKENVFMKMLPLYVENVFLTGFCNYSNWNLVVKVKCLWAHKMHSDIFGSFNTEKMLTLQ